jgi:hypothetical protein
MVVVLCPQGWRLLFYMIDALLPLQLLYSSRHHGHYRIDLSDHQFMHAPHPIPVSTHLVGDIGLLSATDKTHTPSYTRLY